MSGAGFMSQEFEQVAHRHILFLSCSGAPPREPGQRSLCAMRHVILCFGLHKEGPSVAQLILYQLAPLPAA